MQLGKYPAFWLILGLLLTAELAVRLWLPHNVSGRFTYGYDPEAGVVERNNGEVALVRAGGRRFHPQIFHRHRPAEVWRIMVVGDSVPRGPSLTQAYGYRLQELFQEEGQAAEVINMAVPGFGVRRCQLVAKLALRYQPSLIILHLNDSNEFEDEREYRRFQEFQSWHPRNWLMKSFILARAYELKTEKIFWRLLPEKIRLQAGVSDADAELQAQLDPELQARWRQRVSEVTRETVALIQQQQIPVVLLTQAVCKAGPAAYELADHGLDDLAASLAGPLVWPFSMRRFFEKLPEFWRFFADSSHLTAAGHQELARGLAEFLRPRLSSGPVVRKDSLPAAVAAASSPISGSGLGSPSPDAGH